MTVNNLNIFTKLVIQLIIKNNRIALCPQNPRNVHITFKYLFRTYFSHIILMYFPVQQVPSRDFYMQPKESVTPWW